MTERASVLVTHGHRVMAAHSMMINYIKVFLFEVILYDKGSDKGQQKSLSDFKFT